MSVPEGVVKARRRRDVLELVTAGAYSSQDGLVRALRRKGHRLTQATLSRDLRDLRVMRMPVNGGYRYAVAPEEASAGERVAPAREAEGLRNVAVLEVTGVDANENSVIVRTLTGRASGVAVYLDSLKDPDVLGTIAGDDTILVLPRSIKHAGRLRRSLSRAFGLD